MFVNGEVDPWHPLSILPGESPDPINVPTYWVKGASHCEWMFISVNDTEHLI